MRNAQTLPAPRTPGDRQIMTTTTTDGRHPGIDRDDECSECGIRIYGRSRVYWADTGKYCSRRCARSHAEFLESVMRDRACDDQQR